MIGPMILLVSSNATELQPTIKTAFIHRLGFASLQFCKMNSLGINQKSNIMNRLLQTN